VITVQSLRVLFGLSFALAAVAVAGVVVLSALTSWWLLFALFGVPPLLMMVCGAALLRTGGSFARFCAGIPCTSWFLPSSQDL
jgi:hypothetical protein